MVQKKASSVRPVSCLYFPPLSWCFMYPPAALATPATLMLRTWGTSEAKRLFTVKIINKIQACSKMTRLGILYLNPQDGRILCSIMTLWHSQNLCAELRGSQLWKVHWNEYLCMNFSPAGPNMKKLCYCCCFWAVLTGVDISQKNRGGSDVLVINSPFSIFMVPPHVARFLLSWWYKY